MVQSVIVIVEFWTSGACDEAERDGPPVGLFPPADTNQVVDEANDDEKLCFIFFFISSPYMKSGLLKGGERDLSCRSTFFCFSPQDVSCKDDKVACIWSAFFC